MDTLPLYRDDGTLRGFEVDLTFVWLGSVVRLLSSVPGVTNVRRVLLKGDEKIQFLLDGEPCVVSDFWGNGCDFWVGPARADTSCANLVALYNFFTAYKALTIRLLRSARTRRAG